MTEIKQSPRVTIIMPTYNAAKFIKAAVQSVVDQTFTDWELLIFNDGSSDNTDDVIAQFLTDERIRYVKQDNIGQPKTRNKGVRMSRGNLIALLDADDIWAPDKLEKQVEIFEKYSDVGVCGTSMALINPDGEVFSARCQKEFYGRAVPGLITGEFFVAMSASVTRKEIFDKIGDFDEGFLPFSMDFDFWLRASMICMFYNLSECLTYYRTGHASISMMGGEKRRELVMKVVVPRFINEYGGKKYVKWHHVLKLHSDCYCDRASLKKRKSEKIYWLVRSLVCNIRNRDAVGALLAELFPNTIIAFIKNVLNKLKILN